MSDVFSIFMPGHAHWEEVKRAEKMLLVDAKQGANGPDPLDRVYQRDRDHHQQRYRPCGRQQAVV